MSYDEVEIEDMSWSEELQAYTYQCPCGDLFQITLVGGTALASDVRHASSLPAACMRAQSAAGRSMHTQVNQVCLFSRWHPRAVATPP